MKTATELAEVAGSFLPEEKGYFLMQEMSAMLRQQADQLEALRIERDALKQQAQIHAMEAKTANSTIYEIYQVVSGGTGEPGNWNGARPVREAFDALKADAQRWKTIKPHFYFQFKGGQGFWNCSISSESWTVDGIIPDAAIDAMKGAT